MTTTDSSRWSMIIFDLDDTLYLERDYVFSGFAAVAKWCEDELGIDAATTLSEFRQLFDEGVRGETFDRWLMRRNLPSDRWVVPMVEAYRRHTPQIRPFPHIPEMLSDLAKETTLALISDGFEPVQRGKLDALKLASHFDDITFTDSLGRDARKPSPAAFHALAKRKSVEPAHAVYVADNPLKDFRAARAAGMKSIRFRHPLGIYRDFEPQTADDAPDWDAAADKELAALLSG